MSFTAILVRRTVAVLAAVTAASGASAIAADSSSNTTTFSNTDIKKVVSAIFTGTSSGRIKEVTKSPSEMPAGDSTCHYAGPIDGKYVVWFSSSAAHASDEVLSYTAAFALAAMDSGEAGPALKAKFDNAKDHVLLGRTFAEAFNDFSIETRAKSIRDIAWVKKTIVVGMTRSDAYALLKKRGLTAFNYMYVAGKPAGPNGCSFDNDAQGDWPTMNEPLPASGCPSDTRPRQFVPNPNATVDFSMGFNIACGSDETLTLMFDLEDKLTQVQDSGETQTCL